MGNVPGAALLVALKNITLTPIPRLLFLYFTVVSKVMTWVVPGVMVPRSTVTAPAVVTP